MTKLDLLIIQRNYLTATYLEIPFSKNLHHIESIQLICFHKSIDWFLYDTRFYWKVFLNTVYKTFYYFQDSSAIPLIYFLLVLFLIWKIWCYDWPIGARKFTMSFERVPVLQHSLLQARIALHCLNLFLFTTFYLRICC